MPLSRVLSELAPARLARSKLAPSRLAFLALATLGGALSAADAIGAPANSLAADTRQDPAVGRDTAGGRNFAEGRDFGVGPQYGTTHVYVEANAFDDFVASFAATFGGSTSKRSSASVTPTPSETLSQVVMTPVGNVSVFGFKTPIPYPFGAERTGYLVTDLDAAVRAARSAGAAVIVAPFADRIGRDAVIQWPGGVNMQLYWHTTAPSYGALQSIPENRVYLSTDTADEFVRRFVRFSQGKVVADDARAPGIEIGRSGDVYRCIGIESRFGKVTVLVTDGHLPFPYGRELTGYEVLDLALTLNKAVARGASVLVPIYRSRGHDSAMVQFPGRYIAEIHAPPAQ